MGLPGGAEPRAGLGGQRDVPVFGALPTMDLDLETRPIDVGELEGEGRMEPEPHAIDGGEGDVGVEGSGGRAESPDLCNTVDGRERVCGWRGHEREGVPVACEDMRSEEADAAVAEAQRSRGEAIDVFAVQEVVLKCLCSDAVG